MLADSALDFLQVLGKEFGEEDVEHAWAGKTFPLTHTHDFDRNWLVVNDPNGIFKGADGQFCNVVPQPHHMPQFRDETQKEPSNQQSSHVYEAISFSQLLYRQFLDELKSADLPIQTHRRVFVVNYFNKLPRRWRDLALHHDLHLYHEDGGVASNLSNNAIYEPLSNPKNIRLLALLPAADENSPLACLINEHSSDADVEYEALSYTWGGPGESKYISINETPFEISANLDSALRKIRKKDETRMLWIDAICINQFDLLEKNVQVAQMDTTYRNAAGVVVWLGPSTEKLSELFYAIDEVRRLINMDLMCSRNKFNFPFLQRKPPRDVNAPVNTDIFPESALELVRGKAAPGQIGVVPAPPKHTGDQGIADIEALVDMLDLPWWDRIWVLQEFVLASKATFLCGPHSIDWKHLQAIMDIKIRRGRDEEIVHYDDNPRRKLINMQFNKRIMDTYIFFFLQRESSYSILRNVLSLANLLSMSPGFKATNPRDKIFALLGLLDDASDEKTKIRPRYDQPTRVIFRDITKHFLETSHRLDVLTARPLPRQTPDSPPRRKVEGPSWVPDWTMSSIFQYNSIAMHDFSLYRTLVSFLRFTGHNDPNSLPPAGSGFFDTLDKQVYNASLHFESPFPFEFAENEEILRLRGITVDSIAEIGSALEPNSKPRPSELEKLLEVDKSKGQKASKFGLDFLDERIRMIDEWWNLCSDNGASTTYGPTGEPLLDAYWRTILLDRYLLHSPQSPLVVRLPSEIDKATASRIFRGGLDECNFPPEGPKDLDTMLWYIAAMFIEEASFSKLNPHCTNLRFFKTSKGYMGFGHPDVRPGDKVAVLLGASVPLVLREHLNGYYVIGESYVHGVMDGQVIQAEREQGRAGKPDDFEVFDMI